jgi:hypothetical protein
MVLQVRKFWSQLDNSEKEQLVQNIASFLLILVAQKNIHRYFLNRSIRVLAAVVIRFVASLDAYLSLSEQFIRQQFGVSEDSLVGVDFLIFLYEELEDCDVSRDTRDQIEDRLRNSISIALAWGDSVILERGLGIESRKSLLLLLEINIRLGLRIDRFVESYPKMFGYFSGNLISTESAVNERIHSIFRNLITMEEYPAMGRNNSLRRELAERFVAQLEMRAGSDLLLLASKEDDEMRPVLSEIILSLVIIATKGMNRISDDPSEESFLLKVFSLLFLLVDLPNPHYLLLTFDFWFEFESISLDERGDRINSFVVECLLRSLFVHSSFARDFDGEDDDDFLALRNEEFGIKDLFRLCFDSLAPHFLAKVKQQLIMFQSEGQWPQLEVVLFGLFCSMGSLKDTLVQQQSFLSEQILDLLLDLPLLSFQYLQSVSLRPAAQRELNRSICKFLGSIPFLLPKPSRDNVIALSAVQAEKLHLVFTTSLSYCLATVLNSSHAAELRSAAAESFHKLLLHGRHFVLERGTSDLQALLRFFREHFKPLEIPESDVHLVLEALSVCSFLVPASSLHAHPLSEVVQPIICYLGEFSRQSFSQDSLVLGMILLSCVLQVVSSKLRFPVSLAPDHSAAEHAAATFLQFVAEELRPIRQSIFASRSATKDLLPVLLRIDMADLSLRTIHQYPWTDDLVRDFLTLLVEGPPPELLRTVHRLSADLLESLLQSNGAVSQEIRNNQALSLLGKLTDSLSVCAASQSLEPEVCRYYFESVLVVVRKARLLLVGKGVFSRTLLIAIEILSGPVEADVLPALVSCLEGILSFERLESTPSEQLLAQECFMSLPRLVFLLLGQLSRPQAHVKSLQYLGDIISLSVVDLFSFFPEAEACNFLRSAVSENAVLQAKLDADNLLLAANVLRQLSFSKSRKFRAFISDLSKICLSEGSVDALIAYADDLL